MSAQNNIQDHWTAIRERIDEAAAPEGRRTEDIVLVAVSKKQPEERVQAALDAGLRVFGENRVQEALARWESRRAEYPDLELHLVGPLQSNKVADAVALFDVIETLDRPKLAEKLAEEMDRQNRDLPCFIQVNTGKEPQKSGIAPEAVAEFAEYCRYSLGLNITGLMCIPPLDDPPALHFALLKKLADHAGLPHLSMGMSGDFEKAIATGATHIRIGSALFGARPEEG